MPAHASVCKRGGITAIFIANYSISTWARCHFSYKASGCDNLQPYSVVNKEVIFVNAKPILRALLVTTAVLACAVTQEVIGTGVKTFGLELPDPAALLPQRAGKSPAATARN